MPAAADALTTCLEDARALLPTIRANADEAERQGRMTDELIGAYRASSVSRMLVTTDLGGSGLRLPQHLKAIRILSSGDGATGWSLAFASSGPLFGNLLPKASYEEIFSNPEAGIAGALAPMSVIGEAVPGGYMVSGKSSNNSAHRFASHLFFGGMVRRDGQVTITDGVPEIRGFVVPKDQVRIIPNWQANAMVATESDDATIEKVFVPDERTIDLLSGASPWRTGAEASIPITSGLGPGLAAQSIGIARGALDAFREMATAKVPAVSRVRLADVPGAQLAVAEAEGLWMAADALLTQSVEGTWARVDAGVPFELEDSARLRLSSVTATRLAKRAVDTIREHSGMNAIMRGSPLERFTRDIGAITQHVAVAASRFEPVGRHFMGLPPNSPLM